MKPLAMIVFSGRYRIHIGVRVCVRVLGSFGSTSEANIALREVPMLNGHNFGRKYEKRVPRINVQIVPFSLSRETNERRMPCARLRNQPVNYLFITVDHLKISEHGKVAVVAFNRRLSRSARA